jgi:hypothetical protein
MSAPTADGTGLVSKASSSSKIDLVELERESIHFSIDSFLKQNNALLSNHSLTIQSLNLSLNL